MNADLLISALLTIAMSAGVVWLGTHYIARLSLGFPDTIVSAVIPVALMVPLELAAAFFLPGHLVVVYLVATVLAIALQAWVLRILCRRNNEVLSRFKAGVIATLAMLGCVLMGSPIYPLILDHFFKPG